MKKLFVLLSMVGVMLILTQAAKAEEITSTGNAVSGASVTTCANLTGAVCSSGTPLEPISPTPTPTSVPGGGSTTYGGGGGNSSSASCGDTKPNTVTSLEAVVGPGAGQVTLSWLPPSGAPYTSFLIAYSDNPSVQKWGNPNIGNTTTFTVSSLGNATYYFWVAAVNGCMPGDLTGPVTATQLAVLGISSEENLILTPTPAHIKSTKGENVISAICQVCIWWQVLALEVLLLLGYSYFVGKKHLLKGKKIVLGSLPILIYIVFLFLNRGCVTLDFFGFIRASSIFCRLFWLWDLLLFILYIILTSGKVQKKVIKFLKNK